LAREHRQDRQSPYKVKALFWQNPLMGSLLVVLALNAPISAQIPEKVPPPITQPKRAADDLAGPGAPKKGDRVADVDLTGAPDNWPFWVGILVALGLFGIFGTLMVLKRNLLKRDIWGGDPGLTGPAPPLLAVCPQCGEKSPPDRRYCLKDGVALVTRPAEEVAKVEAAKAGSKNA
jgi:hypothetical protein